MTRNTEIDGEVMLGGFEKQIGGRKTQKKEDATRWYQSSYKPHLVLKHAESVNTKRWERERERERERENRTHSRDFLITTANMRQGRGSLNFQYQAGQKHSDSHTFRTLCTNKVVTFTEVRGHAMAHVRAQLHSWWARPVQTRPEVDVTSVGNVHDLRLWGVSYQTHCRLSTIVTAINISRRVSKSIGFSLTRNIIQKPASF